MKRVDQDTVSDSWEAGMMACLDSVQADAEKIMAAVRDGPRDREAMVELVFNIERNARTARVLLRMLKKP